MKGKMHKKGKTILALLAAMAYVGTGGCSLEGIEGSALRAAELAVYPEAAEFPNEGDFTGIGGIFDSEAFDKVYGPWLEDEKERREAGKLAETPDDFYKVTAKEFLTGTEGENRSYSPLNVYIALAVLAETEEGEAREQILDLLGAENIGELRERAKNLWKANYRNDGATTCVLANSVWLNENVSFTQETLDILARDYYASSFCGKPEELTPILREWLKEQTGGLLDEAAENIKLDAQMVMSLCSTVYFRSMWDQKFSKDENDTKAFHGASGDLQTEFMNGRDTYGVYYWGEDFGAINLRFEEGGRMWFILPDEGKNPDDILSSGGYLDMIFGSDRIFGQSINGADEENGELSSFGCKQLIINYSVPKFDISSETELSEGLKNLGVTEIFKSSGTDFMPTDDKSSAIFVSEVKHASRVMIDEEGVTAAAFTEMQKAGAAMPPEDEMDFILDRPFVFVIESETGQPLFTGVLNLPQS